MQSQFPDKTKDLDGEAWFGEAWFIAPRDGFLWRVPYTLGLTRVQQAEVAGCDKLPDFVEADVPSSSRFQLRHFGRLLLSPSKRKNR